MADGVTVSIFGTIHRGLTVDTTPRLTRAEALGILERRSGTGPASDDEPTLVVLPTMLGQYVLAWQATMRDRRRYFVDAGTGDVVQDESVVYEQDAAVGDGRGIAGRRKKVSASSVGGDFRAHDRLRPAEIVTLDMRYNENRFDSLLDPRGARWAASDVARDADNHWQDAAVVDAHVYTGFTYDYLLRQGWRGMNGRDGRILPMVNLDFENAFFIRPPFGPEKTGGIAFGQLRDGTPIVDVDGVAHEIMHGVTHFSVSRRTGERGGPAPAPPLGPGSSELHRPLPERCHLDRPVRYALPLQPRRLLRLRPRVLPGLSRRPHPPLHGPRRHHPRVLLGHHRHRGRVLGPLSRLLGPRRRPGPTPSGLPDRRGRGRHLPVPAEPS